MSCFQRIIPDYRLQSSYTTGTRKKIDCFNAGGFCGHCNTLFQAIGCLYRYCPCQEARSALTDEDIQRGTKKREMDETRRLYIEETGYTVVEMWECEWWKFYMIDVSTGTLERIIPIQSSIASGPVFGQDKIRRNIWLLTV